MRTVSMAEANREFALEARLGVELGGGGMLRVAEPGETLDGDLDLEHGSVLALGDLHVRGTLLGMEEGFVCVVMGALRVGCALVGGAQVIVEGDLVVERAVLCDYDHGLLSVGGDLRAELVLAEHTTLVRGAMVGTKVDFGGFDVRSPGFVPTVSRERATRSAREVFVPEVINGSGCADGRSLYAQLAAGSPVLKAL